MERCSSRNCLIWLNSFSRNSKLVLLEDARQERIFWYGSRLSMTVLLWIFLCLVGDTWRFSQASSSPRKSDLAVFLSLLTGEGADWLQGGFTLGLLLTANEIVAWTGDMSMAMMMADAVAQRREDKGSSKWRTRKNRGKSGPREREFNYRWRPLRPVTWSLFFTLFAFGLGIPVTPLS